MQKERTHQKNISNETVPVEYIYKTMSTDLHELESVKGSRQNNMSDSKVSCTRQLYTLLKRILPYCVFQKSEELDSWMETAAELKIETNWTGMCGPQTTLTAVKMRLSTHTTTAWLKAA